MTWMIYEQIGETHCTPIARAKLMEMQQGDLLIREEIEDKGIDRPRYAERRQKRYEETKYPFIQIDTVIEKREGRIRLFLSKVRKIAPKV